LFVYIDLKFYANYILEFKKVVLKVKGLFNTGLLNLRFFNPDLFNPMVQKFMWLESSWLKNLGLKLRVEKSDVEMSFNSSHSFEKKIFYFWSEQFMKQNTIS
jgi:hypothetical protein